MQHRYHSYLSLKATRAYLLPVLFLISSCSQLVIEPPPTAFKQRMDKVIIQAHADTGLAVKEMNEIAVGAAEGAEYASEKAAVGGAKFGGQTILAFCSAAGPGETLVFIILCPLGIATGAVISFGSVVVGGPVGALYGAARSHSQDEFDASQVTFENLKTTFDKKLASDFRKQFISAVQSNTSSRIIENWPDNVMSEQAINDETLPVVISLTIDNFIIIRDGRLSPDLTLQMNVSADLYDAPEAGGRYKGGWSYATTLGDYFNLTKKDGTVLTQKIDSALQAVAESIVKDIFIPDKHATKQFKDTFNEDIVSTAKITYGKQFNSTQQWFNEQKLKANCGDITAQIRLGRAYADIDHHVYGLPGRNVLLNGYHWLRLAQLSSDSDINFASYLRKLKNQMEPHEIAQADKRTQIWQASQCVK